MEAALVLRVLQQGFEQQAAEQQQMMEAIRQQQQLQMQQLQQQHEERQQPQGARQTAGIEAVTTSAVEHERIR